MAGGPPDLRRELGDKAEIADSLEGSRPALAGGHRVAGRSAWRGAAAAAARRAAGWQQRLPDRDRLERWLVPRAARLPPRRPRPPGPRGEAMPLEEALAYALDDAPDAAA